jgi:UDP-N-acetylmuramoyl-tripeptide--D-alanyl-D-alanine ligase
VGGEAYGGPFACTGVSIDTRTLAEGDLFVALTGARDGEAFVDAALARGAGGLLTRKAHPAPGIRTEAPLAALERLGAAARRRASGARRCAVTGSVGKTSVTQALAAALRPSGPTHAAVESYNNHIGVPLTLARMPAGARFAVFELGMNHAGEIAALTRQVRPHVALITTVGSAHVENFPDGELGVARAKAEIFEGLEPGGCAVLNADAPFFPLLKEAAQAQGAEVWSFGTGEENRARLIEAAPAPGGLHIRAVVDGQPVLASVAAAGRHWALNVLGALLCVEALGGERAGALRALAAFSPLAGRGEQTQLALGAARILLVDESYNANPQSMRAALETLKALEARGRKLAVLTDMLEIGEGAPLAHLSLADPLRDAGVEVLYAAGPLMRDLALALGPAAVWRPEAEALAPLVLAGLADGDVVMVKGSKGSRAAFITAALKAAAGEGGFGGSSADASGLTPAEGR